MALPCKTPTPPGARGSLPSCFSSELVAQQPLGKEAAGRNTLTRWQLRGHGWSRSKGCVSPAGSPGCAASAGLSYPGELGPGAGWPRLLLICYFLPAAMANICVRYVRRGSAFVTQPLPSPVPAAKSRLYGAVDAKWFGKEGALSLSPSPKSPSATGLGQLSLLPLPVCTGQGKEERRGNKKVCFVGIRSQVCKDFRDAFLQTRLWQSQESSCFQGTGAKGSKAPCWEPRWAGKLLSSGHGT